VNVLYLTMNPNRQSTTVPTEGWFRFLEGHGLRPVLVARERGTFPDWAAERGVPVYYDPLPFASRTRPWPFARSMWHLRSIVRRHGIHLIHCNEQDVYPTGQYLARASGLPVVVSIHCAMSAEFCRWAFAGRRAPHRMFFVSRANLETCRPGLAGVVAADRWQVLHNGLDLQHYEPDPALGQSFRSNRSIGSTTILIGVACAIRPQKQLEHLFQAARLAARADSKVILAGFPVVGQEEYAAHLLREAARVLGERFCFVGSLDDVRGFTNALDLFVNTSREEAFSISVLQALACGCPVVGYDSRSVGEAVLPDGGEIVEQDHIDQLAEAIARWTADRTRLRARRAAARRQAEAFDLRRLSNDLWLAYQKVLAAGPGPAPMASRMASHTVR
jgi:L-malate glycosyltransferase